MKTPKMYTKSGAASSSKIALPKAVFAQLPDTHNLLKQVYVSYLANGRTNLATTKQRGEVSGGGRKPWKQKGTGRARAGSIRSPIWRGGGITFGPTGNENYSKKVNKSAKRSALKQALSVALNEGSLVIIDSLELKEGKTKEFVKLQDKMKLQGKLLVVVDELNDTLRRATNNLGSVSVVRAKHLNVFDILNADTVLLEKSAIETLKIWLGGGDE
jgi:large subunit ribosomal protein L4